MEAEPRIILEETLQYLREEFQQTGSLEITYQVLGNLDQFDGSFDSIACSGVNTEWDEGIYFEPENEQYFFYGEPRAYSVGGNKTSFPIGPDLIPLLPPNLTESLKRVAETQMTEIIEYEMTGFLLEN